MERQRDRWRDGETERQRDRDRETETCRMNERPEIRVPVEYLLRIAHMQYLYVELGWKYL